MDFFYFPEDRSELILPILTLLLFIALTFVAVNLVVRRSKKEEAKFEEKYKDRIEEVEKDLKKENH